MARSRGPGNLVAHRPRTEARSDARAHDEYAEMILRDLGGRRSTSYHAIDDGGPVGAADLLLRPLSLFLFACTAFFIALVAWLWQAGILGQWPFAATSSPAASAASSMKTRRSIAVEVTQRRIHTASSRRTVTTSPADSASSDEESEAADSETPDHNTTD